MYLWWTLQISHLFVGQLQKLVADKYFFLCTYIHVLWLNAVCRRWHILFLLLCQYKQTHKLSLLWRLVTNCYWDFFFILSPRSFLSPVSHKSYGVLPNTCHVGQVSYFSQGTRCTVYFWADSEELGIFLTVPNGSLEQCSSLFATCSTALLPWHLALKSKPVIMRRSGARYVCAYECVCWSKRNCERSWLLSVMFCFNKPLRDCFRNGLSVPLG